MDQKNNTFEKVTPTAAKKLLADGIHTRAKLLIWTNNQKHRLETRILTTVERAGGLYLCIPQEANEVQFDAALTKDSLSECFATLTLPTDVLFFKLSHRSLEALGLLFKINEDIFKVQRRAAFRMPFPDAKAPDCKVKIEKIMEPIDAKLLDVSVGGVGVFVPANSGVTLTKESKIEHLDFTIRNRQFSIKAEIKYLRDHLFHNTKKGQKLGISFLGVSAHDENFLSGYVFEECIKQFGRSLE